MHHLRALPFWMSLFAFAPAVWAQVKLTEGPTSVKVEIGGKPFTEYRFAAGDDKFFFRPFAYPVLASDGQAVTSDQIATNPKEHPHHRSLWVAHGMVNGVDHWSHKDGATQRHIRFARIEGDTLVEELEWSGKKPADPALLKETRTLRFAQDADGARTIDLTIVLTPAGGAVTLADTKEAGLAAVRVHPEIGTDKGPKATLTNSAGGKGEKAIWGKPAAWCDASGTIGQKVYGIAILDHPDNPRHPTTWHTREYGLHAANIFGLHDFDKKANAEHAGDLTLEPGKTTTFKYRIVIHTGDATSAALDRRWKEFSGK